MRRPTRVGIDAHMFGSQLDGTQMYVRNLIRGLAQVDPDGDYRLIVPHALQSLGIPGCNSMHLVHLPPVAGRLRVPFSSSWTAFRAQLDVLHVQFAAPLFCTAHIVATVHDVMYEHHPEFYSPADLRQLRLRVAPTVRRAGAILTVSDYSRRDIIQRFNLSEDRVIVAQGGPDPMFQPIDDKVALAAIRRKYGTGDRFILFAGALKPNKNLKTLLAAYVRLRCNTTLGHRLVLVGAGNLLDDPIFAPIGEADLEDAVVFTGHVSEVDLVALYNAAELFAHPSLFEGFGLPPLEAMACGTPVICSNTTSLPEAVGDAAVLVDPLDVEALAKGMSDILSDDNLRRMLSRRGLERASAFSWRKAAQTIASVYHQLGH